MGKNIQVLPSTEYVDGAPVDKLVAIHEGNIIDMKDNNPQGSHYMLVTYGEVGVRPPGSVNSPTRVTGGVAKRLTQEFCTIKVPMEG